MSKQIFTEKEDKILSLSVQLKREFDYQAEQRKNEEEYDKQMNCVELHFDTAEKEN